MSKGGGDIRHVSPFCGSNNLFLGPLHNVMYGNTVTTISTLYIVNTVNNITYVTSLTNVINATPVLLVNTVTTVTTVTFHTNVIFRCASISSSDDRD